MQLKQSRENISQNEVIWAARNSLIAFARLTHPNYKPVWFHKLLAHKLECVARGTIKRLIISMPPRHGKTELASIRFAPWFLGKNPDKNIALATYSAEFAEENSEKAREIVDSNIYREIFNVSLKKDTVSRWRTQHGGNYYAVGIGGALTGRGANILIVDDPHKNRKEAESVVKRKDVWDWFASTAYTRLEKDAAVVVIMTRWHDDDLVGRLLKSNEEWDILSFPAIAEKNEHYRKVNTPLWQEKYDLEALLKIKSAIGSREFTSLYQGAPSAAEGEIFKRDWWQYYLSPPTEGRIIQSWDTAFKAKEQNDYSACTTWRINSNGFYLLHRWMDRVEFPDLKRKFIQLANEFKADEINVEDKASGQSLIQELNRETSLPIIPVEPAGDKIARANGVTPIIEAGKVFLPEDAVWLDDYLANMSAFPNGMHDDDVDSTTQALSKHMYGAHTGLLDHYDKVIAGIEKDYDNKQRNGQRWHG